MAAGPAIGGGGRRGGATQTVGVLNLLTDLAFNLLIFFVVCASTEPEKGRPQQVGLHSEFLTLGASIGGIDAQVENFLKHRPEQWRTSGKHFGFNVPKGV